MESVQSQSRLFSPKIITEPNFVNNNIKEKSFCGIMTHGGNFLGNSGIKDSHSNNERIIKIISWDDLNGLNF
jgi:hypothetical protein